MFKGHQRNWKATLKYISNISAADDSYKTGFDFSTHVSIIALYNTIQYLERQKFDWSDGGKKEEIRVFKMQCAIISPYHDGLLEWFGQVASYGSEGSFYSTIEGGARCSVIISDLLKTFMSVMKFSTLPVHSCEVYPMHVNGKIRPNIHPQNTEYFTYWVKSVCRACLFNPETWSLVGLTKWSNLPRLWPIGQNSRFSGQTWFIYPTRYLWGCSISNTHKAKMNPVRRQLSGFDLTRR